MNHTRSKLSLRLFVEEIKLREMEKRKIKKNKETETTNNKQKPTHLLHSRPTRAGEKQKRKRERKKETKKKEAQKSKRVGQSLAPETPGLNERLAAYLVFRATAGLHRVVHHSG